MAIYEIYKELEELYHELRGIKSLQGSCFAEKLGLHVQNTYSPVIPLCLDQIDLPMNKNHDLCLIKNGLSDIVQFFRTSTPKSERKFVTTKEIFLNLPSDLQKYFYAYQYRYLRGDLE